MSDYITELRRELVGAAERERRRSAPRRALARSRRPLGTAFAGAAAALAAVLGIAVLGHDDQAPPAGEPSIMATIRLGGIPEAATVAAGSVWVVEHDGRVLRIDPRSRRAIAAIDAGTTSYESIAATPDAVWVVTPADDRGAPFRLVRIDPEDDRVVARIGNFSWSGATLAAAPGGVWVQGDKQAPPPLRRVDPDTNRLGGAFGKNWLTTMAAAGDRLWTLSYDGVLQWRDATTGRLLGQRAGLAPLPPGGTWRNAILADADGAWVATGTDGTVMRLSADGRVQLSAQVDANGPVAVARGALWVTVEDGTSRHGEIRRVDPSTGEVTGRIALGSRLPRQLLAVGDDLWAVLSDGSVIVVR